MKIKSLFTNKLTKIILILAICTLASAIQTQAAPPANNNLANAATLTGASGTTNGTTLEATIETGEGYHTNSEYERLYRTVWFEWTAPQTKPVSFEITSGGFDAGMAAHTGSAYPVSSVTMNNNTIGLLPRIEFLAVSGTSYKIVVGIYNDAAAAGGNFTMQWMQTDTPRNNNFSQALNLQNSSGSVSVTNHNADTEAGEPIFGNGNTVWANFTNTTPNDYSLTFNTMENSNPSFDTTLAVYTGAAVNSLSIVVKNNNAPAQIKSKVTFLAKAGVTYRIAVDSAVSMSAGNIVLSWDITKSNYYTDFGTKIGNSGEIYYDDAADITVFRPSDGVWYSLDSSNGSFNAFQFGLNGDTPIPADYDGDGRSDYAVTRNSGGLKFWHIRSSFDGSYKKVQWGIDEDRVMPGDYDLDGRTDIAIFRPSTNVWYIWRSSDNQFQIKQFGLNGDIPVLGDFKGTPNGTDIAVFRPSNGTWYIFDGVNTIVKPFGLSGDKPVPGNYDYDDKTDLAVYRPTEGIWYYLHSSNNEFRAVHWGLASDILQPGDYDNNQNDPSDFVVFRPTDQTWYILKREGFTIEYTQFGLSDDIPISAVVP